MSVWRVAPFPPQLRFLQNNTIWLSKARPRTLSFPFVLLGGLLRAKFYGKGDFLEKRSVKASGYSDAGASFEKVALAAFRAVSISAIEDIDWNNATLRQRGRMLYMAAPVAAAAINVARTKIVGPGLKLKCSIDRNVLGISANAAQSWQKKTEAEFKMWAEKAINCDARGANNFYELQSLAVKAWLMSGDTFAALKHVFDEKYNPYSLRIQMIEADRIRTPLGEEMLDYCSGVYGLTEGKAKNGNKIHDGVEVDKNGRIVAYYIHNSYPNQMMWDEECEAIRVEARGKESGIPNILQIMDAERPDQYRGVTYLAPVIEVLLQSRRYTESQLVAALIQSMMTGWITQKDNADSLDFMEDDENEADGEDGEREGFDPEYQMRPGEVYRLKKGEEIIFGNPNVPTANFSDFMNSIFEMAGAALEIPKEVLLKKFTNNYSASKGALEEMSEMVKMRRSWFVSDFCRPIYEAWLAEAVALGRIKAPGFFNDPLIRAAWCGSRWDGPAQTHLDPEKEAKANELIVKNRWKTNGQIAREVYGSNYSENVEVLAEESEALEKITGAHKEGRKEGNEDDNED